MTKYTVLQRMYETRHISAAKIALFFSIETVVTAVTPSLSGSVLYSVQIGMLFVGQYLVISIIHRFLEIWKFYL